MVIDSILYIKANVVSVCVFVTDIHGLRPGQLLRDRARCHGLLYIQCGCVIQFGTKRCVQRAKWGCTRHNGQAKLAWAAHTGPVGLFTGTH